ncbi:MAG: DnaK suppressor protein [Chloroflexia bacterium]|jgi:DnaK suppressor protein|nr:DnaK suppressor protein [Chloroflexia bacterium]
MADVRDLQEEQDDPVTIDLNTQREKLLSLQTQLEHDIAVKTEQIAESGDELVPERGGVTNHVSDDANETVEQEMMLSLQMTAERQLDRVRQALARLDEGTYGTCANCGKEIAPARLDARPWAIYCIDCQQLDDQGRI